MEELKNPIVLRELALSGADDGTVDGAVAVRETGNRMVFSLEGEAEGRGSSCAVYAARRADGAGGPVRLKRCLSQKAPEEQRFLRTVRLQFALLREVSGIAHLWGVFRGEDGHLWSLHSFEHGVPYHQVEEESLWQLLRNGRYLAEAVRRTHQQGYLHLDLSAANVFLLTPGSGREGAALVDCDSFVPIERQRDPAAPLYTSPRYGGPEVHSGSSRRIGPAADVYSLGVLLFEKLFGRLPTRLEGGSCAPIPFAESRWPERMTGRTRLLLEEFFNHTICTSPATRLPDMEAVIQRLDALIALTDPRLAGLPRLCRKEIRPTRGEGCFVPRDEVVRQIREAFDQGHRAVVLLGPGGVGKTEAARQFAMESAAAFDGMELAVVENPTGEAAIRDGLTVLNCSSAKEAEDCIRQLDEHNLILLDNYDFEEPEHLTALSDFLAGSGRARVLITTRMARVASLPGVAVVPVESDAKLSLALFRRVCPRPLDQQDEADLAAILRYLGYHTYATDLIASALREDPQLTPAQLRRRCEQQRILAEGGPGQELLSSKDGRYAVGSAAEHFRRLFADLLTQDVSAAERAILVLLSRAPAAFLDAGSLCQIVGDHGEETRARTALNRLIRRSWVKAARGGSWSASTRSWPRRCGSARGCGRR